MFPASLLFKSLPKRNGDAVMAEWLPWLNLLATRLRPYNGGSAGFFYLIYSGQPRPHAPPNPLRSALRQGPGKEDSAGEEAGENTPACQCKELQCCKTRKSCGTDQREQSRYEALCGPPPLLRCYLEEAQMSPAHDSAYEAPSEYFSVSLSTAWWWAAGSRDPLEGAFSCGPLGEGGNPPPQPHPTPSTPRCSTGGPGGIGGASRRQGEPRAQDGGCGKRDPLRAEISCRGNKTGMVYRWHSTGRSRSSHASLREKSRKENQHGRWEECGPAGPPNLRPVTMARRNIRGLPARPCHGWAQRGSLGLLCSVKGLGLCEFVPVSAWDCGTVGRESVGMHMEAEHRRHRGHAGARKPAKVNTLQ
ncbi:hypothetical protein P4O66_007331 [Electrophorus voltai]|uniref:Uncharacterized protein n=1 Tax=Electrophorus voltai TaxID=2609070 RepID=A0AAD9DZS1_9TELE|nr:hypothetical protein P4O66_007331 [Electrophorus voltai]